MSGLDLIITITDRSKCELFINWFRGRDIPLVLTALGQGTATTEILDCLGLEASEKSVLFCLAPHSRCMVRRAARDLWLDVPGNGVLMTVPVSSIGGTSVKEYLTQNQEGEEPMEREIAHELILVIANQGHTDQVIHAKGTGMELAKKFFGVSIASERELVFILTRSQDKKNIMKAIMAQAGIQTPAQAMVFSVPVSDIAGLRHLDQAES